MATNHVTVPQQLLKHWGDVITDMEETAATYREDGWETIELHPGHVDVLSEGASRSGFDVLVPDNEFDEIMERGELSIDEFKIFRTGEDGIAYCLVVGEDRREGTAVFVPIYYEYTAVDDLRETVSEQGFVRTHVHPLSKSKGIVTYEFDDPEMLFPDT